MTSPMMIPMIVPSTSVLSNPFLASVDPALEGRELGPWLMIPASITVPLAVLIGVALAWYFVRLGRSDVTPERRIVRRMSIGLVAFGLVPFVRGLSFVHPHEDRIGFAVAWSAVLLLVCLSLMLAIVDFVLTARRGMREFRTLRDETLSGKGGGDGA